MKEIEFPKGSNFMRKIIALSKRDFSKSLNKDVKLLPMCGNKHYAKVDISMFEEVKFYSWHMSEKGYATTVIKGKNTFLHKLIWSKVNPNYIGRVDHINSDKLDCTIGNLRECSHSQNMMNRPSQRNGKSIYKGVCYCSIKNKWRMQITAGTKRVQRYCNTEIEAAIKYNEFAKILHGEFAFINKIPNPRPSTPQNV